MMNICGDCKRFMGCSWERDFVPVEGWTAKEVKYNEIDNYQKKVVCTYDIIDCPLFIPPNDNYKKPKKHEDTKKHLKVSKNKKKVRGMCIETGEMRIYESVHSTFADGFVPSKVSDCIHGRQKNHKGWRFWLVRTSTVEKENIKDAKGESE